MSYMDPTVTSILRIPYLESLARVFKKKNAIRHRKTKKGIGFQKAAGGRSKRGTLGRVVDLFGGDDVHGTEPERMTAAFSKREKTI